MSYTDFLLHDNFVEDKYSDKFPFEYSPSGSAESLML